MKDLLNPLKFVKLWWITQFLFLSGKRGQLLFYLVVNAIPCTYCMSKKAWPISYSNLLYKMDQNFLDIQYVPDST